MILLLLLVSVTAKIFGYYNVYIPSGNAPHARGIVAEQYKLLNESKLLQATELLTVNVISELEQHEIKLPFDAPNIKINFFKTGGEETSLNMLKAECASRASSVYYIHSKGSYTQTFENTVFRNALMTVIVTNWLECHKAIVNDNCDVCGLRFSPYPHAHFAGNFWWTHCGHINRLVPTNAFERFLSIDAPDCRDYSCGRQRCGYEHWVTSHPLTRAYDCLHNHEYVHSYEYLTDMKEFNCISAPRSHLTPHSIMSRLKHRFFHNYASGADSCQHTLAEYELIHPNVSLSDIGANTVGAWMQMCAKTR